MTKPTNSPKLRFPKFSEEWENRSITDDFSIIDGDRGKHYPSSKDLLKKGDCIFLSAENVTKKGWSFKNLKFITRKKDISMGKGKLKLNDLILTTRGTVGNVVRYHEEIPFQDMRINSGMVILRTIQPSQFFLTLFTSNFMKRFLNKVTVQSAQPHLTVATIKMMKFFIPKSIEEQEKIGTFFSKLDHQIELEEKKLELLEQQKKGYIQKIFSQELRFKDENNNSYPEWKIKKLEEISEFQNGKAHENFVSDTGNFILVNSKFISTESKVKKYVDKQLTPLRINDIAIVMSDVPNGKALAKCYLIENDNTFTLNQRIGRIFNIEGNSRFLFTQINRNKQLLKYDSGVGQTNLKKSEIIGIKIYWPNKREQDKIGDFFINLDLIIEKQSTKVELLKQRKQGLLQKMFV